MTTEALDPATRLASLKPETIDRLLDAFVRQEAELWAPLPGPQAMAFNSEADCILYGGQAGGGKTDLGLGLALTRHQRSLFCRRRYGDLEAVRERAFQIVGSRQGFNGGTDIFRLPGGRVLQFFAALHPGDERNQQGQPKDLLVVDEAAHWQRPMIDFLMAWVRTTDPNQRCRTVLCSNPPTAYEEAEGASGWLMEMFAPWVDRGFSDRPAAPGELRWVISDADGRDQWVEGPGTYHVGLATPVEAKSRTFIGASVDDNPYLASTGYRATLQALPEPLRSALLLGDWSAAQTDNAFQLIPSPWVKLAQQRWEPGIVGQMDSLGVDVAMGGLDETIICERRGTWFGPLKAYKGVDTSNGPSTAALVFGARRDGAMIGVDAIGWGQTVYDFLHQSLGDRVIRFIASERSVKRTQDGIHGFANRRAEIFWKLREALDPELGRNLALPPDLMLAADLTSMRWKLVGAGILIESKDEIKKRLGRSPDRADALAMAWATGTDRDPNYVPVGQLQTTARVGYERAKMRYGSIAVGNPWRGRQGGADPPLLSQEEIHREAIAAMRLQTRSAPRPRQWRR